MQNNVFKALAHPLRREALGLLRQGPRTAGQLAAAFDSSWPTVSRHLGVLKDADLVIAERIGTSIVYRANVSVLEEAAAAILALMGTTGADESDEDQREAAK